MHYPQIYMCVSFRIHLHTYNLRLYKYILKLNLHLIEHRVNNCGCVCVIIALLLLLLLHKQRDTCKIQRWSNLCVCECEQTHMVYVCTRHGETCNLCKYLITLIRKASSFIMSYSWQHEIYVYVCVYKTIISIRAYLFLLILWCNIYSNLI